jgi:hypothetical protein
MLRHAGILSLLTVPAAMFIASMIAEPQLRLRGRIWAGELRSQAVPVADFEAPASPAASKLVRIDHLSFRVPTGGPEVATQVSQGCAWVRTEGLTGLVFEPIAPDVTLSPADSLDLTRLPRSLVEDPAALRAAAYAAGSGDLSMWMNASDVDSLTGLLEAKTMLCVPASRVEWFKLPHLSGVLIISDRDDYLYMTLEYFAPEGLGGPEDKPMRGMATLAVDPHSPQAVDLARSIISSIELD